MVQTKALTLCALAVFASGVWAQGLLCTMPNGVTIEKRIGDCPDDAVRVVTAEGKLIRNKALPSTKSPARLSEPAKATPVQAPPAKAAAPSSAKERDIVQEAHAICTVLKTIGATTCEVNVNIFSSSSIEATLPTTPRDAKGTCHKMVEITRQRPGSPFIGRGWELRMFSPFGNGNRPMAVCTL